MDAASDVEESSRFLSQNEKSDKLCAWKNESDRIPSVNRNTSSLEPPIQSGFFIPYGTAWNDWWKIPNGVKIFK